MIATLLLTHGYQGDFYVSSSTESRNGNAKDTIKLARGTNDRERDQASRRGREREARREKGVGSLNTDKAAVKGMWTSE